MMYNLNKIASFFVNPLMAAILGAALAAVLAARGRRRAAVTVGALSALWLALWGTTAMTALVGAPLERPYLDGGRDPAVEDAPVCEAIVLLGGGMGGVAGWRYPNVCAAADRVWHAARLYRAGKAPLVVVSGFDEDRNTIPLLADLGVPREAIRLDGGSRNTYENARFTEQTLGGGAHRVLLVTSAWHMTRALGNFSRTELEPIPAACDFEATMAVEGLKGKGVWQFALPTPSAFAANAIFFREWLGRLARK